ncbi:MAG: major capsid protein, partial [Phycisphaerales bacterium]
IDINQQFKRRAGEQPVVGTLTPQQRYDATIAENFRVEREMIEHRINWMCAQALVNGAVVVEGEDYPRVTIDFNRDADLTEVLTSTARWGESAADPLGDLNIKMRLSRKLSGGRITNVIMGEEAYDRFYRNADVKALLDTNYRIGGTAADASILGMGDNDKEAELKAILSGGQSANRVQIWTYAGFFHQRDPETGTLTEGFYIDPNAVVGVGNKLSGVQCFGAIKDPNAGLRPMRIFPRIVDKKNDDPAKEYTLSQSAPLPVPMEPNNSFKLQVHDAA